MARLLAGVATEVARRIDKSNALRVKRGWGPVTPDLAMVIGFARSEEPRAHESRHREVAVLALHKLSNLAHQRAVKAHQRAVKSGGAS